MDMVMVYYVIHGLDGVASDNFLNTYHDVATRSNGLKSPCMVTEVHNVIT